MQNVSLWCQKHKHDQEKKASLQYVKRALLCPLRMERPAEGLHAAELNGIPRYDLGEERHFPVRLVLELMLFVC